MWGTDWIIMEHLNFKAPRDLNTKSVCLKIRDIASGEYWPCHVGGGECCKPAIEAHDDGNGGEFLICKDHIEEVYAFGKLVAEMSMSQCAGLQALINLHE